MSVENRVVRLRALMAERGYDAVVLRNNPDLRWLTGAARVFDSEHAHTAYVTADGLWFHTDSRYCNALTERLGEGTPWQVDMELVDHAEWLAGRVRATRARTLVLEDTVTVAFAQAVEAALQKASAPCTIAYLHGDLVKERAAKEPEELDDMRAAQAVTDAAFAHMCGYIQPGMTEQQIRAELDNFMLSNGADGLSFDSIVASGPNTANPHAIPGERKVETGDFVLLDYGARVNDYCSDMTRTMVVGEPTPKHLEIYGLVKRVHEECAAFIRPGVEGRAVHELAVRLIAEAGYGDYFKHGLGHGVGIEIHEQPNLGRLSNTVLAPGHVVTVEPGVYLPGWGGVRIEDYGVVTEQGFEPFTKSSRELVVLQPR